MRIRLLIAAILVLSAPPLAAEPASSSPYAYQQLNDPAKEAKAKALMETLRCLVCQGQSIADSDAALAGDMRNEVRTKIADLSLEVTPTTLEEASKAYSAALAFWTNAYKSGR